MAPDLLGTVARHQADEQRADHRHDDRPPAEMVRRRRHRRGRPPQKICRVGDNGNEPQERLGHHRADRADGKGEQAQQQHSAIGAKIRQQVHAMSWRRSGGDGSRMAWVHEGIVVASFYDINQLE